MAKARTLVGLDVHASKVVAAMLDAETGELRFSRLAGETDRTLALCAELEPPLRVAYEAGPTGFGLARALTAAGIDCVVAAPGKIPRAAQDRVQDRPPRRRAPGAAALGRPAAAGARSLGRRGGDARPRARA